METVMPLKIPKTTRVQQEVLNLIATAGMQPGMRLPASRELAESLCVSNMTVVNALNEMVHRGILERIQGKGTFVRQAPAGCATMSTCAFLLINRSTYHYELLLEDCRRAAREQNHELILIDAPEKPDERIVRQLLNMHGVLCSGVVTDDWVHFLNSMRMPAVGVGRFKLANPLHCVAPDFEQATCLLVHRLYERGCRNIGLISGATTYIPAQEMNAGYVAGMKEVGLPVLESSVSWWEKEHRFDVMRDFFMRQPVPFDGCIVQAFHDFQLFAYEYPDLVKSPILGTIDLRVARPEPLRKIEQAICTPTLGEAAIRLLLQLRAGTAANTMVRTSTLIYGAPRSRMPERLRAGAHPG
jgi:DNA-binding MarR family transcriptional regulator